MTFDQHYACSAYFAHHLPSSVAHHQSVMTPQVEMIVEEDVQAAQPPTPGK